MLELQKGTGRVLRGTWYLLIQSWCFFCFLGAVVGCAGTKAKQLIQLPPRFQISKVVVLSGLYKDQVIYTVEQRRPEITACYMEALRGREEFSATLVLRFRIDPTGAVQSAGVEGRSRQDKAFESCVLSRIRASRFTRLDIPAVTEVPVFTLDFFPPEFP